MATTITVLHNQSFQDIAIQHTGNVFNAFIIAKDNAMAISEFLAPGTALNISSDIVINNNTVEYYQTRRLQPATSLTNAETVVERKGIGYMKIGSTFKTD